MKQKSNIFEELNKMKNLITTKRGVVISEQEFNEDTIGSYERAELNKIDPGTEHRSAGDIAAEKKKQAELDAKYNAPSGTGWFDKFPILHQFLRDTSYFKAIHYPTVRTKDTGLLAAQRTGDNEKYYYGFFPDGSFYISEGWNNLLAKKPAKDKWTGTWKVDGTNLIINTADGDSFSSGTKKWKSDEAKSGRGNAGGGGNNTNALSNQIKEIQSALGLQPTGQLSDEELTKILAALGGESQQDVELPTTADGQLDLTKILASL